MAGPDGPSKTASSAAATAAQQNSTQKQTGVRLRDVPFRAGQPTYSDGPTPTGIKPQNQKTIPSSQFDPLLGPNGESLDDLIADGHRLLGQSAPKHTPAHAQSKPTDKPAAHAADGKAKTAGTQSAGASGQSGHIEPQGSVKQLYPGLKLSPHQKITNPRDTTDYTPKHEGEAVIAQDEHGVQKLYVRSANQIWECPLKSVKKPYMTDVGPDGTGIVHYMPGDMVHVGERKTFSEMCIGAGVHPPAAATPPAASTVGKAP